MHVLVTGATGFLGAHVARALVRRGERVRALVRPETDPRAVEALGAEVVRGDLLDEPSLHAACHGAEALVHLKGKADSDPDHTIMVTLNSFYTTPLRQPGLGVDIATFTPIARMAEDTFLLWVNKDSGITNIDEFVAVAKEAGNDWVMAGTGKLQEDQLLHGVGVQLGVLPPLPVHVAQPLLVDPLQETRHARNEVLHSKEQAMKSCTARNKQ